MKKLFATIATALALIGAAPVHAEVQPQLQPQADPAAAAAAREMFESMNYRAIMVDAMQQMSQGIGGSIRAGAEAAVNGNPALSAEDRGKVRLKMEAILPNMVAAMQEAMSDPTLVDDIMAETIPLYARTYSADELRQIAAFYRTPVGVKVLATMPKLTGEGMQIGQRLMLRRIGPMMQKMQLQMTQESMQQGSSSQPSVNK
jgi:hypothetical protein